MGVVHLSSHIECQWDVRTSQLQIMSFDTKWNSARKWNVFVYVKLKHMVQFIGERYGTIDVFGNSVVKAEGLSGFFTGWKGCVDYSVIGVKIVLTIVYVTGNAVDKDILAGFVRYDRWNIAFSRKRIELCFKCRICRYKRKKYCKESKFHVGWRYSARDIVVGINSFNLKGRGGGNIPAGFRTSGVAYTS